MSPATGDAGFILPRVAASFGGRCAGLLARALACTSLPRSSSVCQSLDAARRAVSALPRQARAAGAAGGGAVAGVGLGVVVRGTCPGAARSVGASVRLMGAPEARCVPFTSSILLNETGSTRPPPAVGTSTQGGGYNRAREGRRRGGGACPDIKRHGSGPARKTAWAQTRRRVRTQGLCHWRLASRRSGINHRAKRTTTQNGVFASRAKCYVLGGLGGVGGRNRLKVEL